jgi:hypothetical protein
MLPHETLLPPSNNTAGPPARFAGAEACRRQGSAFDFRIQACKVECC